MLQMMKKIKKEKDNSHSDKSKETNIYLLEYIKFSNQITNYKKLNTEQKIKLDQYARNNIPNVLTKVIEGMCSFYVKKNLSENKNNNISNNKIIKNKYKIKSQSHETKEKNSKKRIKKENEDNDTDTVIDLIERKLNEEIKNKEKALENLDTEIKNKRRFIKGR